MSNPLAYYNENDPKAAAWLGELIHEGHIAFGIVDTRSIEDVTPNDLAGFTQCHFFAGIGGWSYALRLAGWPDSRPVWTGSCPCQPFSQSGALRGFTDPRHLYPAWSWLIGECKPVRIYGEQVAAATEWLDLVSGDLEDKNYAFWAVVLGAHSVGAPHIRQRLYFVADAISDRDRRTKSRPLTGEARGVQGPNGERQRVWVDVGAGGAAVVTNGKLADANGGVSDQRGAVSSRRNKRSDATSRPGFSGSSMSCLLGDAHNSRLQRRGERGDSAGQLAVGAPGVDGGFWADAEWIACSDGKERPAKPGIFPLAHGIPDRVGLLRGAGNAIVPQVAAAFIKASEGF